MRFPKPPKPPKFYWNLSLKNRQRFCRYVVNPWWKIHWFFSKTLTKRGIEMLVARFLFWQYCRRGDLVDFINRKNPAFLPTHHKIWSFLLWWPGSVWKLIDKY